MGAAFDGKEIGDIHLSQFIQDEIMKGDTVSPEPIKTIDYLSIDITKYQTTSYKGVECLKTMQSLIEIVYEGCLVIGGEDEISDAYFFLQDCGFSIIQCEQLREFHSLENAIHFRRLLPTTASDLRVAFLVSGRVNDNQKQYDNFIRMQLPRGQSIDDVDIFVSHAKNPDPHVVSEFAKMYKPKIMWENNENRFDFLPMIRYDSDLTFLYMMKNRKNCIEMMKYYSQENNREYDLIVSTRADLMFEVPIDYERIYWKITNRRDRTGAPRSCKPYTDLEIYMPNICYDYLGINDQLAIGKLDSIEKYMSISDRMEEYIRDRRIELNRPEAYYRIHCFLNKIKIRRFFINYFIHRM